MKKENCTENQFYFHGKLRYTNKSWWKTKQSFLHININIAIIPISQNFFQNVSFIPCLHYFVIVRLGYFWVFFPSIFGSLFQYFVNSFLLVIRLKPNQTYNCQSKEDNGADDSDNPNTDFLANESSANDCQSSAYGVSKDSSNNNSINIIHAGQDNGSCNEGKKLSFFFFLLFYF